MSSPKIRPSSNPAWLLTDVIKLLGGMIMLCNAVEGVKLRNPAYKAASETSVKTPRLSTVPQRLGRLDIWDQFKFKNRRSKRRIPPFNVADPRECII